MTDLHGSRFRDLLPPNLRNAHTAALSYALDRQMRALVEYIPITLALAMVDQMSETMCDQVALSYNIQEYAMDMKLAVKREVIRFTFQISARKGTRWAVNRLIETIFGFGETEEWFEYNPEKPYYFRVKSTNKLATPEDARRFRAAINDTKNVRSWLDDILILRTWHDVLEPFYWKGYSDGSWKAVPKGRVWEELSTDRWEIFKDSDWGTVSGDR